MSDRTQLSGFRSNPLFSMRLYGYKFVESSSISRNTNVVVYGTSADYIEYYALFGNVELEEASHSPRNQRLFTPSLTRLIARARVLAIT